MRVGITGGLGCGKSTVVKIFGELGFRTLDSDDLVKAIYAEDGEVKALIRERFGEGVLDERGEIDRGCLAKKVFGDREALLWLENLVHPRVKRLRDKYIAEAPDSWWAVEIPLLFEKKLEKEVDVIICLSARNDLQESRLSQKGINLEDVRSRVASQMPLEQKEKRADYVIYNNESIEELRKQVYALVKRLKE